MSTEHLHEGVSTDSLHDLDGFIAAAPGDDPPQEFQDAAQEVMALAQSDSTQFDPLTLIALAGLLFQLYTYFKNHRAARFMVGRAAAHPHGFAAQLVHHKVNAKLPAKLQGVPNVAAGVTQVTDVALTKAGV